MSGSPAEPLATFTVDWTDGGGTALHRIAGEIDMDTAGGLTESLNASLTARPATLAVDLSEVTFLDSSGVSALVHTFVRAGELGIAMEIVDTSAVVRRVLELTGVWDLLTESSSGLR